MTATQVPTKPPAPRRRTRGWVSRFVIGLLVLAILGVLAAIGFVLWTDSKIDRIPTEELGLLEPVGDGPRNFLVVGTDSRENLPDDFENFGNFAGSRTDVIMLVHFVPGEGAQLLSLPRDLKVEIAGEGTNRINAAYTFGGPALLVDTVERTTGVTVNHYLEIDFAGFARLVDALGGVTMTFDHDARDRKSGFAVEAGEQRLDGEMALAYVRSRQYQEYRDGRWRGVAGSDIGRTGRQQALLLAVFDQLTSPSSAFNLPGFVSTFAEEIRADEGLRTGVILELGRNALGLDRGSIQAMTLPVRVQNEERSYVVPVEPKASAVLQAFIAGEPFPES
jgi:LCP family protein required for cell wall assembly